MAAVLGGPDVIGVRARDVTEWLCAHVGDLQAPLRFTLIAGGRSNLTYRVDDAHGRTVVLRRPPVAHVLATAHDMAREHRILHALAPTPVPVPSPLGLCSDPAVNGAPFYVMTYIEGVVLRDASTADELLPAADARRRCSEELADTLAALHSLDVDSVGLGDLARRDDYVLRQIRRWSRQFAQTKGAGVEEPGAVERVAEDLVSRVPRQQRSTIVHGDYRLDNAVVDPQGHVVAVLDWELCTLGDPMADLGTFLDYWSLPIDGEPILGREPASALEGFLPAEGLLARYGRACAHDTGGIEYYMAFGYWRLACILQGVFARYRAGAAAGDPETVEHFPRTVARLARLAATTLADS